MEGMAESIFVSIAAYRDPELMPTVADCIRKACNPERLRFGICWQRGKKDARAPVLDDPAWMRCCHLPQSNRRAFSALVLPRVHHGPLLLNMLPKWAKRRPLPGPSTGLGFLCWKESGSALVAGMD
jgi:hypothetical protein